jgi:hypothetical protein
MTFTIQTISEFLIKIAIALIIGLPVFFWDKHKKEVGIIGVVWLALSFVGVFIFLHITF